MGKNIDNSLKIGLALSGGGTRAGVFHAGILKAMATRKLLDKISFISSVSGGSIVIGLILIHNNYRWPTNQEYLDKIFPKIEEYFTQFNLQRKVIIQLIMKPYNFWKRNMIIRDIFHDTVGITGNLQDLPDYPRWSINANTFESGKSWRFSKQHMGDYLIGYVDAPEFPLADAIAISASFPYLIPAYELDLRKYQWLKYKSFESDETTKIDTPIKKIHLQDGGMYENTGVEALFEHWPSSLRNGINALIISDASAPLSLSYDFFRTRRQMNILSEQVRSLRTRGVVSFLLDNPGRGLYLQLGKNISAKDSNCPRYTILNDTIDELKKYKTDLANMSENYFHMFIKYAEELFDFTENQYPLLWERSIR